MHLGERCDEIVRMIDETLAEVGIDGERPEPPPALTTLERPAAAKVSPLRRVERPERAAAGF
jgi:hypothetical protein